MIRIAICENDKEKAVRIRGVLDAHAAKSRIYNVESVIVDSPARFEGLTRRVRKNFFDLVLYGFGVGGVQGDGRLAALVEANPKTSFVLLSDNPDDAMAAYGAHVRFLQKPFDQAGFNRVVARELDEAVANRRRLFSVKASKGVTNMNLGEITFVESNKKGPIIHLPDSKVVATRGTLQALFDKLNTLDERFVRAGGSFIINLDNVRSAGESSVIFADGEAIILPVRARKVIVDSYNSYLVGASR